MDKLKMYTPNKADENFKKLAALFPNAVTETINENGEVVRAIDKDVLMQEISCTVVEGKEERYQFTWPDKKKSVLLANAPIAKTLRPCREESVGKDGTPGGFDSENLYIEADNLEVLKLLQETYLGKIKMIYIDPPYNTGNDFVYEDYFTQSTEEYLANSGQFDDEGNRLVTNTESIRYRRENCRKPCRHTGQKKPVSAMTTDRIPAWIITAGSTDSPCETPRLTKVSNAAKIKSAARKSTSLESTM